MSEKCEVTALFGATILFALVEHYNEKKMLHVDLQI